MSEEGKKRLSSSEQKIQELIQARAQSEKDLNGTIAGLQKTVQQKAADLAGVRDELATEKNRWLNGEDQLKSLREEKERSESSLQSAINTLTEQSEQLQEENTAIHAALETKETVISSLEKDLAESVAEKKKSDEESRAKQVSSDTAVTQLNETIARETSIRSAIETDLEAAKIQARTYADELALASGEKAKYVQQVQSLSDELKTVKEALEQKESLVRSLKENLEGAVAEKEQTEERVRSDMESYKTTFIRLKHDLDETLASRRVLEKVSGFCKNPEHSICKGTGAGNTG